jgi:hypothetical protein
MVQKGVKKMLSAKNGEWIADLETMTCRNYTWEITVSFENQGDTLVGKITDLPDSISRQWLFDENRFAILDKILKEAEQVFLMAYYSNILDKYGKRDYLLNEIRKRDWYQAESLT